VDNLSLSGKLVYWMSDKFIVNWESLSKDIFNKIKK